MGETLLKPAEHKQLFIDDHAIHSMSGVSRRLGRLEKLGPVLRPDRSRGQTGLQSRSSPIWNPEKGLWEWWHNGVYSFIGRSSKLSCYATSRDGVEWEAPSLGLFEVNGSRDNNVAGDPNGRRLYHILRDEREEDPARRYKGLFDSHDRWLGVSPDGFDWTMLDVSPIPSQDESHFIYDEYTEQFLAFVKQATSGGAPSTCPRAPTSSASRSRGWSSTRTRSTTATGWSAFNAPSTTRTASRRRS